MHIVCTTHILYISYLNVLVHNVLFGILYLTKFSVFYIQYIMLYKHLQALVWSDLHNTNSEKQYNVDEQK